MCQGCDLGWGPRLDLADGEKERRGGEKDGEEGGEKERRRGEKDVEERGEKERRGGEKDGEEIGRAHV